MEKIYVISEDGQLYNFLINAPKYGEYLDNIEFVNITSVTNIVDKNICVILDKENYELDALRLFAKKMYVIICTENGMLDIDVEEDNKVLVVGKPYSIEQLYAAIKLMIEYRKMETNASKTRDVEVDVKQAAQTDYLTGLPNRRGMYEHFSWGLRTDTIHCMFMDIDNFKKVNDTYGHKMGDKLLIRVSHMVKEKIGDAFFARLSGDEFAAIIDGDVPKEQVIAIAESIIGAVDEVQLNVDVSSIISFSIGIMLDQSSKEDLDDILLRCDVAMYQAKKGGKGRYIVYNDIARQVEHKMSVDRDKYTAFSSGQFKLYFRPRIDMATMAVDGIDARIYWEHPKDGLRKSDEFINILEEDSFIVELENQMFDELCRIMSGWKNTLLENQTVCYRMSKKHMYKKNFVEYLNFCVSKYNLSQENFSIAFMELDNHPKVNAVIQELKRVGYGVTCAKSIAEGKTSLLNINDTLATEWIIYSSLIRNMGIEKTNMVLTKSIISLAKELNIHIMASGVEESKEAYYLTRYGCDVASGDFFTEAMRPAKLLGYVQSNMVLQNKTYVYFFDNNLKDQNGWNEGKFIGEQGRYIYDKELDKNVLYFDGVAGGVVYENTVELPASLLNEKSYTISISFKAEVYRLWNAILYAAYENGFISIMPHAWDGVGMFRVKDNMYEDEWHDAVGREISVQKWHYITATYNSRKKESRFYVDGELQALVEDTHTVENCSRLILGGDPWQGIFHGSIGHVVIHDYVIKSEVVKQEYMQYIGNILGADH